MKNLEIKKMSLANVEAELTPAEMEIIMAGSGSGIFSDCGIAIGSLAITFAGAFVTTTPIGAGIFLAGMIYSGVGMRACR